MTSMAGENLLEAAAPPQPDAPAIQGQEVRRWWTGLGGTQATSLILGVGGWILVLNGLLGILLALIGMFTTKEPRGRWWSFYAILVHVSPWLLFTAWVWLSMRFGSS